MNEDAFQKLPADLQEILAGVVFDSAIYQRNWFASEDDKSIQIMLDSGVKVNDLDVSSFLKKVDPVYTAFYKQCPISKDIVTKILAMK